MWVILIYVKLIIIVYILYFYAIEYIILTTNGPMHLVLYNYTLLKVIFDKMD